MNKKIDFLKILDREGRLRNIFLSNGILVLHCIGVKDSKIKVNEMYFESILFSFV